MSAKSDEAESGIVSKFNDDLMGVISRALDAEECGGVRSEVILDRMVRTPPRLATHRAARVPSFGGF